VKVETKALWVEFTTRSVRGFLCSLFVLASEAFACPLCHTEAGHQVRAGIFNSTFPMKLLLTAAPFPVLAGLIAFIYFGMPKIAILDGRRTNGKTRHRRE
jgi:hypothetical protein